MGNLFAYSAMTTKIRSLRSTLFTSENYQELASMADIPNALEYLKKHPAYGDLFVNGKETALHRGEIEHLLTHAVYRDFQKIYRFASAEQRRFLKLYFHRYEVSLLKTGLRMVLNHRNISPNLTAFEDFFRKHSDVDLAKVFASRTLEEFAQNLSGSIYDEPLRRLLTLHAPALRDYELALDLFYFKWFFRTGCKIMKKGQLAHFREAYGTKMDLLNISWIYRSHQYFHMSDADIYAQLIPVQYHLHDKDILALVLANSEEEFTAALRHTYYRKYYEKFSDRNLAEAYICIRQTIQRKAAVRDPYSIAPVISYLYEKEHEIDKITTVLECIRYGLPQEKTLRFL